jgi:hypothetical protein
MFFWRQTQRRAEQETEKWQINQVANAMTLDRNFTFIPLTMPECEQSLGVAQSPVGTKRTKP